jgi:hypothetical protein
MVKLGQAYSAPTKTILAESSVKGQYVLFSLRNRLRGTGSLPVRVYHSEGGSLKNYDHSLITPLRRGMMFKSPEKIKCYTNTFDWERFFRIYRTRVHLIISPR